MIDYATHEYVVLRETIRERGGARLLSFLVGIIGWAALLLGTLIWLPNPVAATVPLLVLVATFEVVRTLHLNAERIGRYLQVFYEESAGGSAPTAPPAWEHAAMHFGPAVPGAGAHPLFLPVFLLATVANFLAVIFPGPVMIELAALSVPHLSLVVWLLYCDRGMRRQRAAELTRYRSLREQLLR